MMRFAEPRIRRSSGEDIVEKTPILEANTFDPEPYNSENVGTSCTYWQPISLKWPSLLCSLLATFTLLSVVLFLHYRDHKHGAIIFADTDDYFSKQQMFLFRYLPIIIFVAFGFLISIIDLDVKRLEPWYQLSSGSHCAKGKALMCLYDTDFVLNAMVKAVMNRHWAVSCCSLLFILATMVVPAIQNSIFATRIQAVSWSSVVATNPKLLPLTLQQEALTVNFMTTAYGVIWLGQALPAFTSKDMTLSPFELPSSVENMKRSTITSRSTKYWSELSCWPPASITANHTTNMTSFTDGRGCTATGLVDFRSSTTSTSVGLFKGSYFGPLVDVGLQPPRYSLQAYCPQSPHLILATWVMIKPNNTAPIFNSDGDASAVFCEPEYYMQEVNATVSASNGSVISTSPLGNRTLLNEGIFNRTNFEVILSQGANLLTYPDLNQTNLEIDIADASPIAQNFRLSDAGVARITDGSSLAMPAFALGLVSSQPEDLLDPSTLQQAFTDAFKLNFALAMSRLFLNKFESSQNAGMTSLQNSVHVVPVFAIITEVLLAMIAALSGWLLYLLFRRTLGLLRDPESFAEVMVLAKSEKLQQLLQGFNFTTRNKESRKLLIASDVKLKLDQKGQPTLECYEEASKATGEGVSLQCNQRIVARLPELSSASIMLATALLIASIAVLLILNALSSRYNGLKMFETTEIVKQILLNLLPTAFATLLGAYITLLCRVYSFLHPLEELRKGGALATRTMSTRYTSSLPALLFTKTWQARHILLTVLSIITLLTNTVLTVSMASLFIEDTAESPLNTTLQGLYQPVVMIADPNLTLSPDLDPNSANLDSIYTVVANLTEATILPSWTTHDYAFLPLNLSEDSPMPDAVHYEFEATGYGADLECFDLLNPPPTVSSALDFRPYQNNWLMRLFANYTQPDGLVRSCWFQHKLAWDDLFGQIYGAVSSETMAFEMSNNMFPTNSTLIPEQHFCANQTVKGWVRAHVQQTQATNGSTISQLHHNTTLVSCSSRLKTRQHLLRVTPKGDILAAQPIGAARYDLPPTVNLSETHNAILRLSHARYDQPLWHNDTVARDWSNYVYKKTLNDTDLLDATKPPSFELASKLMSDTFSSLFAIQLSFHRKYLLPLNVSARAFSVWDTSAIPDAPPGPYTVSARAYYSAQHIFISQPNFIISTAILILDLIVLTVFRFRLSKPFLPRMPFTIASQIAYFAGSNVVDDIVKVGGDCKVLDAKGYRYGYGRYIGKDGLEHVGIERMEFIIPEKDDEGKRGIQGGSGRFWWACLWKRKQSTVKGSMKVRLRGFESVPGHDRSGSNESAKSLRGHSWI